jgi:hypothetical protein
MFSLLGVTFLQQEQVIAERMPGGAAALGSWLQAVQGVLAEHYADSTLSGCRSLTLAIGPDGPIDFWLTAEKEQLPVEEQGQVRALVAETTAPIVTDGPVVVALVFSIGHDAPAEAQLTMPDAWRAVAQAAGKPLSIEEIVLQLQASRS